ncbi:MAG: PD40 domain-containing protein [Gemmatimonadetes bacterium]|nr:PD40 domain-containing protein [Gemmatimonadota bacterium]
MISLIADHAGVPLRSTLRLVAGVLALAACKPSARAPALPGGSVVGARASRAAPPAAASTLVFYSTRSGNAEIWAVAPDGSNPRQLTDHAAQDVIPSLSRDGRRIAFQSNRAGNFDFWVMDSDGSNPMPLTTDTAFETSPA